MTEEICVELVRLLITAGHNSTTGSLGNSIMRIARAPEIQRRLRAEPALIPSGIEEFLPLETPVQAMPRWANEPATCTAARSHRASRSCSSGQPPTAIPRSSPSPTARVLDRSPNPHLTFGRGIHRCIGMDLARLSSESASKSCSAHRLGSSWPASPSGRPLFVKASRPCRFTFASARRQRDDRRRPRRPAV